MGKNKNPAEYKQPVAACGEQQIMREWSRHLRTRPGDKIGHWRPLLPVLWDPVKGSWTRQEGLLVKNDIQLDLYFHKRPGFNHEVLFDKLVDHPFVDNCAYEKEKSTGGVKQVKGGKWQMCYNDHLSPKNIGVRTTNNVATIFGYSKNDDGPPTAEGKQMTHCWAMITHGRKGQTDGGQQNYEMLANLLCELCGFTFPFRGQFTNAGQLLNWHQPVFLTSAVGDIEPAAVGHILPPSAVGDGHLPASSSNQPSSDQAPAAENTPQPRLDLLPPPPAELLPQSVPPPPPASPPEVFDGGRATGHPLLSDHPVIPRHVEQLNLYQRNNGTRGNTLGREIPVYRAGPVHKMADGTLVRDQRVESFSGLRPLSLSPDVLASMQRIQANISIEPDQEAEPTPHGPGERSQTSDLDVCFFSCPPDEEASAVGDYSAVVDNDPPFLDLPDGPQEVGSAMPPVRDAGGVPMTAYEVEAAAGRSWQLRMALDHRNVWPLRLPPTLHIEVPVRRGAGTPPPPEDDRGGAGTPPSPEDGPPPHTAPESVGTDSAWTSQSEVVQNATGGGDGGLGLPVSRNFDPSPPPNMDMRPAMLVPPGTIDRILAQPRAWADPGDVAEPMALEIPPPCAVGASTPPPAAFDPPPATYPGETAFPSVAVGTPGNSRWEEPMQRNPEEVEAERLLALGRSEPTQPKFSKAREPRWADPSGMWLNEPDQSGHARNTRIPEAGKPTSGGRCWSQIDWVRYVELFNLVPDDSVKFDTCTLAGEKVYHLFNHTLGNWREWMHDHNISCRKKIENQMKSEHMALRGPPDASDGRWRLSDHCVVYSRPWEALTREEIFEEYKGKDFPLSDYMKHLVQRFEGEVALTWEHWTWESQPLPRNAEYWNQQFATNEKNFKALGNLRFETDGWGTSIVHHTVELERVGNTTILRTEQGQRGHWHLSGGAITLADLFFKFGDNYTVSELMNYYYNSKKVCRKRAHAWGSPECRQAALQRYKSNGHYGHQSHEIDPTRPASNRP